MLLGASVLCFLVMLVLLADKLGAAVFHGETNTRFYRCEGCDVRYPKREMIDPELRVCPAGHLVKVEKAHATAGIFGVFVCLGFLCAAGVFLLTGMSQ